MTTDQGPLTERYERGTELGRGGMGVVWRATDKLLDRPVAIKEIRFPPTLEEGELDTMRARVLREARSAARLNHPSAVSVFDVVQNDGMAFIVMELVDAPTLSDIVKSEGPLSPRDAARVGSDVLGALRAAHAEGIVHRDVKPANVMVPPAGPAKLADFGIASVTDDPRLTASGMVLGSPAFMAPEQGTTGRSTAASDLWGLGATLYFAVEGKAPFEKGTAVATLTAVMNEEIRFSGRAGKLESTIRELLEKDPDRRPDSGTLSHRLAAITSGGGRPAAAARTDALEARAEQRGAGDISHRDAAPPIQRNHAADKVDEPSAAPARDREAESHIARQDRRGAWVVAAILAALAIGATLFFLDDGSSPENAPGRDVAKDDGSSDAAASGEDEAAEDEEANGDEEPAEAPEGWDTYTDEATGYSIAYPEGWQEVVGANNANQTDFRDPDSGTYLRVEWQQPPADDAVAAWESAEAGFSGRFPSYERVRLEEAGFKEMPAALWEYTYSDGGAQLHAYNLGFITEGEKYGMALNFQTHESDWSESQELWDIFTATFSAP